MALLQRRSLNRYANAPVVPLSIKDKDEPTPLNTQSAEADTQIQIKQNGPLLVKGACLIKYPDGREDTKEGNFALCRCGGSANKPYCDGTHTKIGFKG